MTSLVNMVVAIMPPQRQLVAVMPYLRALRAKLMEKGDSLGSLADLYELITEWDESGLKGLIKIFNQFNYVGEADKVVEKLTELQHCIADHVDNGVVMKVKTSEWQDARVFSAKSRAQMISLIDDIEFLCSECQN
ncbi:MAG: hypothetical protein AAB641_01695 [Patescibacteria group bacterium]